MIVEQDIFAALRSFIASLIPNVEVVQAQDNGVPMPTGSFIAMNNVGQRRMSTNMPVYIDPLTGVGTKAISADIEYTIQIDFYGEQSSNWAATIQTMFRDDYAYGLFPEGIKPLYADDPKQVPLISGEEMLIQRWIMQAVMQYNPIITVPQQFADSAQVNVINVPATYP
jgi:phosphoenolpyruvate carboxylase